VLGGQFDHDPPLRVAVQRFGEPAEIGNVVEHVMAHDDVGGSEDPVRDVGPATLDLFVSDPERGRPARERAQHLFALIHAGE
jgi:hypothetical protein